MKTKRDTTVGVCLWINSDKDTFLLLGRHSHSNPPAPLHTVYLLPLQIGRLLQEMVQTRQSTLTTKQCSYSATGQRKAPCRVLDVGRAIQDFLLTLTHILIKMYSDTTHLDFLTHHLHNILSLSPFLSLSLSLPVLLFLTPSPVQGKLLKIKDEATNFVTLEKAKTQPPMIKVVS